MKGGEKKGGKKLEAKSSGKRLSHQSSLKVRRAGLGQGVWRVERRGLTFPMIIQVRYSHFSNVKIHLPWPEELHIGPLLSLLPPSCMLVSQFTCSINPEIS